jgi:cytochrome b
MVRHPAVVRLCHWALAALVVFDWIFDDGGRVHRVAGYAAGAVVLLRLSWAAIARDRLVPSVPAALAHARLLLKGAAPRGEGHNPLGLWMVWLLWLLVLALAVTGFLMRLDAFWGDDTLHDLHALLAHALALAVLLHVAAIGLMSWLWKENLPAGMITGRRQPL